MTLFLIGVAYLAGYCVGVRKTKRGWKQRYYL